MSTIETNAQLKFSVRLLDLTESEARALDALVGYGIEPFLKVFYKEMGASYMRPHESGLRALFESVNKHVRPALSHIDDARKTLITKARSR